MSSIHLETSEPLDFQQLMEKSYKKVFNLAYRLSGNRSDAEDLTQEAFYRAFRKFDTFQGDRPFENWIFRIVTRLFLDMKRARSRRVQTVSSDAPLRADGYDDTVSFEAPDDRPTPSQALVGDTLSEELEHGLSHLTEDQRELVWLADVEGLPYDEIAVKFSAPVGTIRSRLHRAHKQLRRILEQVQNKTHVCGGFA
ncbi:MAG: RNA polymerase sigma factor [Armatimonadetes bacterium]|nr:RNA polymerase sigma factor [Armatimonadota bacterium]MBS1710334.1 RNA polymerase sigma factor [Armatimonadota bacterium]MBX3109029.1 RNA polymerase sigma factor [Fimbriimonadaceae bacterium]